MKKTFYFQKYCLATMLCLFSFSTAFALSAPRWKVVAQGIKNSDYYKSIAVINDDTIYVLLNTAKVLKTTNGGGSWTTTNLPAWVGTNLQPRAICFPTPKVGYVAGDNNIAKTTDYGKTWTMLTSPTGTLGMTSVFATSENTCYFGASSKVYYTNDGGVTFSSTTVGTAASAVIVTPNGSVYRAGGSGGIYKSINGGTTFSTNINTKTTFVNNTIQGIYFSDNNTGYAVGLKTTTPFPNNIIKTTDGGTTWNGYALGSESTVATIGPNAVCIPATGDGFVVGTVSNTAGDTYIRKTTDAGLTFSIDTVGAKSTDYYAVAVTPRGDVYVAGNGYLLIRKIVSVSVALNDNVMGSVTGAGGSYYAGESVNFTAVPNEGYEFVKWTDGTLDISTSSAYTLNVPAENYTLTAIFKTATTTLIDHKNTDNLVSINGRNLKFNGATGRVEIYNSTGHLIHVETFGNDTYQLNNCGIYLVKMETSQGIKTQKFLIQ